ncbi:hypothetical protein ESY86_20270 [Subsaximicrobium wynnwilliamsii]|uniref:Uncharacterized protein n=1 Tax=Subsaximicrobium wynnwilliamsii TaxID=291179 RepID=A0A5C6ZB20_9FLAO|nr:hypothetical protein [Subsaximicrobium wynnwilliamsii]TXD80675.1 hypothetical protein ESY87_20420 [Subsaximicrobium wynnwilliamsii]TXD86419.1 hypothetical protein ESY86_20270 [Subsaximicrobium wynnwilliamsii]TXD99864.1 hypothetical protein ESY88_20365 [Subsaximicrobium wynnwilliamsii]
MKNMKIIGILFLTFLFINSCRSDDDSNDGNSFCEKERVLNENIENITAELIYLDSKNKYALRFYPNFPTIDEVTYSVLCIQPEGISIDDAVKFTGELYFFNSNENFNPSVGGENFYFTKIEQIQKLNF